MRSINWANNFFAAMSLLIVITGLRRRKLTRQRALNNYIMLYQGCHLPDNSGVPDKVPSDKDLRFIGFEGDGEF